EMTTNSASITNVNEFVVVTSFNIELGASGGNLIICLPYSMIEPVRDLLTRPLQEANVAAIDQRWTQQLSRQVRSAEVELVAEFVQVNTSIAELLKLQVNDVLPIDISPTITAHVGGVPVMTCGYGTFNGRYALRVQKILANADTDLT